MWYTALILSPVTVTWPKIAIFEIQDGGSCYVENRFFGHYSLTDCPISAKFCMRKQNCMLTRATGKMQMCKIQDGGRPAFSKSLNRHISVKNCPILMKFCTLHQILNPATVTSPKIEIFGVQHLEIRFLATTHRPIVRFRQNFVCGGITACRQRPHDKKLQVLKIQEGGRPPFWKSLSSHISVTWTERKKYMKCSSGVAIV